MTSAIATTEQMSKGQIGQPAACMIENKLALSTGIGGVSGRAIMAHGCDPIGWVNARSRCLAGRLDGHPRGLGPMLCTATVDIFVGNPCSPSAKPRVFKARVGLLKV
jgi:hypothetical protein